MAPPDISPIKYLKLYIVERRLMACYKAKTWHYRPLYYLVPTSKHDKKYDQKREAYNLRVVIKCVQTYKIHSVPQ